MRLAADFGIDERALNTRFSAPRGLRRSQGGPRRRSPWDSMYAIWAACSAAMRGSWRDSVSPGALIREILPDPIENRSAMARGRPEQSGKRRSIAIMQLLHTSVDAGARKPAFDRGQEIVYEQMADRLPSAPKADRCQYRRWDAQ